MFKRIVKAFGGDPNQKAIESYRPFVDQINALEDEYAALSDEQLRAKTDEFKARLAQGETLDDLMVEAFTAVREASKRTLGQRHYDTQLIAGMILHQGKVAEMRTGEGKTLMSTLPLYLNALEGKGVHLITVNDYLARRDARWMAPIYHMLGLSVGVLQMGQRTEGGQKAFIVDLEKEGPQEDQHQMQMVHRQQAYGADITYGTNNEFGFDYLRDNMALSLDRRVQRGHHYAIIDEVDNVLIDEARTPLIISGPSHDDAENYVSMAAVVKRLKPQDYEINEKDRTATLTEIGEVHVEQILGQPLRDPDRPEDITNEQARLLGYLEQAMRAQFLFKRNKDYLVQGGQVIIIDEFTGRLMPGRRWSDGLHQSVEAKENVPVQSENITHATITIQNYFRMYTKLSGMTGTAMTEEEEFDKIYSLQVLALPPGVEYNATGPDAPLVSLKAKDEYNYEYTYYAASDDPDKEPIFYKRKDYPDVVFRSQEGKLRALVREIIKYNVLGRPILLGTTSVENSERLSSRLRTDSVRKLMQVLLLRYTWLYQNDRIEDGRVIMALSFLNEDLDKLSTAEMRSLAKDLKLQLNPEQSDNLDFLLEILELTVAPEHRERLTEVLKRGITHQVLNARKHTEESQIIAGAGAFGAVTIATNMAGRGVDIKLGGEIAEEILSAVNRILRRSGVAEPYEMSLEDRLEAVRQLTPDQMGIYETEIKFFQKSMEEMGKVKELGGLHVIGSERHEARRIDNQLRGRAARQGDPGSSRFYLSMEDDLMRLFGGQQVDSMMQRLGMDDAMPLEHNMVSRIIESSQTRVEGANFDARKHLLEYDDVLNSQRVTIYSQRDRIFVKEDLTDDIREMLEMEVQRRVPEALDDEQGPWRLLAWLEQIQPSMVVANVLFPSFTYQLLLESIKAQPHSTPDQALAVLLGAAENSINAEEEHIIASASAALTNLQFSLENQLSERLDSMDTFFDSLKYADETDTRGPQQMLEEVSGLVRAPIKLERNQMQLLREDPDEASELIADQVHVFLMTQAAIRLLGSVERRLNEPLELNAGQLAEEEWDTISETVTAAIQAVFENRRSRLLGADGQIARDLKKQLDQIKGEIQEAHLLRALILMPQGERRDFDKRTHRQVRVRTTRLVYAYHAAQLIDAISPEEMTKRVLNHLEAAQAAMTQVWGLAYIDQNGESPVGMLTKATRTHLQTALGARFNELQRTPLNSLQGDDRRQAIEAIGRHGITETYRQLILRVISELWIEYLTKMEALRVSIGLEAYAQRDPLVQYKARASEMFAQLFQDMRMGVVSRMFTFGPSQQPPQPQQAAGPAQTNGGQQQAASAGGKRKRKRKRR